MESCNDLRMVPKMGCPREPRELLLGNNHLKKYIFIAIKWLVLRGRLLQRAC